MDLPLPTLHLTPGCNTSLASHMLLYPSLDSMNAPFEKYLDLRTLYIKESVFLRSLYPLYIKESVFLRSLYPIYIKESVLKKALPLFTQQCPIKAHHVPKPHATTPFWFAHIIPANPTNPNDVSLDSQNLNTFQTHALFYVQFCC